MPHLMLNRLKLNSNQLTHNQRPLLNQYLLSRFNSKSKLRLHRSKVLRLSRPKLLLQQLHQRVMMQCKSPKLRSKSWYSKKRKIKILIKRRVPSLATLPLQGLKENQWTSLKKTSSQPTTMTMRNCLITTWKCLKSNSKQKKSTS